MQCLCSSDITNVLTLHKPIDQLIGGEELSPPVGKQGTTLDQPDSNRPVHLRERRIQRTFEQPEY